MRYFIAAVGALLWSAGSIAQNSSTQKGTAESGADELQELVVTGSRLIENGDASPSPTTIFATQDALTIQPGQLSDALQILPVFAGSRGSSSNPTSTGAVAGGNGAANQMNLRNLGIMRTLPLLDGLRLPPSLFNGSVDVDIIPQMLIQRVDIVTGGVSAVYGSDAISGAVNYVIDKNFTGLKTHLNGGISSEGDAKKTNLGVAFGTDLAGGRGHFEGSYEYRNEDGVLYRSDRDWIRQAGVTGAGTAANPYVLIQDTRQGDFAFGGVITNGPLINQWFKTDGTLSPFVRGVRTGNTALDINGDGAYYDSSLLTPVKSNQLFARLDFDLSDKLRFHLQSAGNIKTNHNYADYVRLNNVFIRSNNAFLSPTYQALMGSTQTFRLRSYLRNAPRLDAEAESDQWVHNTGVAGKFGKYDWGLDFNYGKTKLHTTLVHNINYVKLAASLDAQLHPTTRQPVCNVTLTNPGLMDDCVPLNPFGPTAASNAALNYFLTPTEWNGQTTMQAFAGYISGAPFNLPAGPFKVAFSGEWRKASFSATTTSDPDAPFSCTAIRDNCTTAIVPRLLEQTLAAFPKNSDTVWEVATEIEAPIFGKTESRGLNLNGAARYTNYERSGKYLTWKVGLDWRVTDELRFRGTTSRDIRAPTLYDLYAPANGVLVQDTDLLTGLSPSILTSGGGNGNLKAEKGSTLTAGLVWKPLPRLSIALDYFRIKVANAITDVGGREAQFQQQCYDSGGSSPYCALQVRPVPVADAIAAFRANPASVRNNPAFAVTRWYGLSVNVAEVQTSGFDVELNYGTNLIRRPLTLRLLAAFQPHVYFRQPAVETQDYGGVGWGPQGAAAGPDKSVTILAKYAFTDNLTLDLMERWRDRLKISGVPSLVFAAGKESVASFATTNLNLTYEAPTRLGKTAVFLNVQNVFNKNPPVGAYFNNGTRSGLRDGFAVGDNPMGRYFTMGLRVDLQ
jgi:outer membrane receptor protein involved in Fe transport